MKLFVNGETKNLTTIKTLAELLTHLELTESNFATAVNGNFVSKNDRDSFEIHDGDHIEILSPMQGG